MDIFDDLEAEQDRLNGILEGLGDAQWLVASAAAGWSIADVVLHLAQTEEAVVATAGGASSQSAGESQAKREAEHAAEHWAERQVEPEAEQPRPAEFSFADRPALQLTVDEIAELLVRSQRAEPADILRRWQAARVAAVDALRNADPGQPLRWVEAPLKPATLATTRLAEHWAHALDIIIPLDTELPDTDRLRHIAWLAHRTLPYAFALAGQPDHPVRCHLTAPDGATTWQFGPPDAPSAISGPAGSFCRVAAQRLRPEESALRTEGPHAPAALAILRTYAA